MDWARAIERNRDALIAILSGLFAMLGLEAGGMVGRIPRQLHRAVLRVLRPAESAMRRLIVIAARGLVVKTSPARPSPKGRVIAKRKGGATRLAFQLFDTRKRFDRRPRRAKGAEPRIVSLWPDPHLSPLFAAAWPPARPVKPADDGCADATRLCRRLTAIELALADLPRQARRLLRAQARREKVPSLAMQSPMRPGRPPGHRSRPSHEVDEVLAECHWLARDALRLDTS